MSLFRIVNDVLSSPLAKSAIVLATQARDSALHGQDAALGFLNLPTADNVDRILRQVRGLSQRLEHLENTLDDIADSMVILAANSQPVQNNSRSAEHLDVLVDGVAVPDHRR
ncbi:hypothetical protein [Nocardia altamirensis]|uniref:hypothetical protein n=1 Tax=Nocardia altamirensis TaxID=472158 RepID=UPI0008406D09|nr:hypothetical protein [Nocardia altamirensis]